MDTILIVDDCPEIRKVYTELLSLHGFRVMAAEGGFSAHDLYLRYDFQIIMTDMIMDKMCGNEFIAKVRENNNEIPIIAISGNPRQQAISKKAGANVFLEKPFCSTILIENINRHLEQKC